MTQVSKRALKTLELIKKGKFYACYDPNLPATIKELVDAKLIIRTARVGMVHAAYAPAERYVPMRFERFADDPEYQNSLAEIAGPGLLKALKELVADLEIRAVKGVVDCSHGVYIGALEEIAKAEGRAP